MNKQAAKIAMLTCTLVLSLASVNAYAAPERQLQTEQSNTEAAGDIEAAGEDAGNANGAVDVQEEQGDPEKFPETEEDQDGAGEDSADTGEAEGQDPGGAGPATDTSTAASQERVTAERIQAEKSTDKPALTLEDGDEEDDTAEEGLDNEDERPTYTAPEDSQHANASFAFSEAASSAFFKELTYPVTVGLKEVDTGDRVALTIRSAGQILEVGKGDYTVVSIKDSGKVPLSVPGDTLHIYENTEYPVRFAANNALKLFTDFLMDNIFLACFFVFAALFYSKVFIPMFANDARRR